MSRRQARASVRDMDVKDLLSRLQEYGKYGEAGIYDNPEVAGFFNPESNEVVIHPRFKGGDVEAHEMIHAGQVDPSGTKFRIQDQDLRRASRKFNRSQWFEKITPTDEEDRGGKVIQYITQNPAEFEAVIASGGNTAREAGVDFNQPYNNVIEQLEKNVEDNPANHNAIMILDALKNRRLSSKQKEILLYALRGS